VLKRLEYEADYAPFVRVDVTNALSSTPSLYGVALKPEANFNLLH